MKQPTVTFAIPAEMHAKAKAVVDAQMLTLSEFCRRALVQLIETGVNPYPLKEDEWRSPWIGSRKRDRKAPNVASASEKPRQFPGAFES